MPIQKYMQMDLSYLSVFVESLCFVYHYVIYQQAVFQGRQSKVHSAKLVYTCSKGLTMKFHGGGVESGKALGTNINGVKVTEGV